jgi:hypothetical protein
LAAQLQAKQLSLLAMFQRWISVEVLLHMGDPQLPWHLRSAAGLTLEHWQNALSRIAQLGLARQHGEGYWEPHPFLPAIIVEAVGTPSKKARIAWINSMAGVGERYADRSMRDDRWVPVLMRERLNLLRAQHLAYSLELWTALGATLIGLRPILDSPRYREKWNSILESMRSAALSNNGSPRPGREDLAYAIEFAGRWA